MKFEYDLPVIFFMKDDVGDSVSAGTNQMIIIRSVLWLRGFLATIGSDIGFHYIL